MSLQPLLDASLAIQLHIAGALIGFVLGSILLLGPKGTLPHRTMGIIWVLAMSVTIISSIFIHEIAQAGAPNIMGFSFIHIFTLMGIYSIPAGLLRLLRGGPKLKRHGRHFRGLFIGGILIAGVLAFLPGRTMHAIIFGG